MKYFIRLATLLGVVSTVYAQGNFEAIQGYTQGSQSVAVPGTGGWGFRTLNTITVTSLGCAQALVDAEGGVDIGLWTDAGLLLGSSTITPANLLVNFARYGSVTPIVLEAGQTYRLGAASVNGLTTFSVLYGSPNADGTVTLASDIALGNAYISTEGFNFPGSQVGDDAMLLGATFLFQPVPEASTIGYLCLGGLSLVFWRRARRG